MDIEQILLKNPAEWTEEEQIFMINQTDNSLKKEDKKIKQPEQTADWQPDPDEVIEKI